MNEILRFMQKRDERTDAWTDGWMDGRMDGQRFIISRPQPLAAGVR